MKTVDRSGCFSGAGALWAALFFVSSMCTFNILVPVDLGQCSREEIMRMKYRGNEQFAINLIAAICVASYDLKWITVLADVHLILFVTLRNTVVWAFHIYHFRFQHIHFAS